MCFEIIFLPQWFDLFTDLYNIFLRFNLACVSPKSACFYRSEEKKQFFKLLKEIFVLMSIFMCVLKGCEWAILAANWWERCSHHKDRNSRSWGWEWDSATKRRTNQVRLWTVMPVNFFSFWHRKIHWLIVFASALISAEEAHLAVQKVCEELTQKLNSAEADKQNQWLKMTAEIDDLNRTKVNLEERLIELIRYDLSEVPLSAASMLSIATGIEFLWRKQCRKYAERPTWEVKFSRKKLQIRTKTFYASFFAWFRNHCCLKSFHTHESAMIRSTPLG